MKVRTPFIIISRVIIMLVIIFYVFPTAWLGYIALGIIDGTKRWWKGAKVISADFLIKDWWTDW